MEIKAAKGMNVLGNSNVNFKGIIQKGVFSNQQEKLVDLFEKEAGPYNSDIVERLENKFDADIVLLPKKDGKNVTVKIRHNMTPGKFYAKDNNETEIAARLDANKAKSYNQAKIESFLTKAEKYLKNPNKTQLENNFEKWAEKTNNDAAYYEKMQKKKHLSDEELMELIASDLSYEQDLHLDSLG